MDTQTIKLTDGTELVPLEQEEKENLELEIKTVLDKYNAIYLPVINEQKTLTNHSLSAKLFLFKRKEIGILSTNEEVNPILKNGDNNNTTEETPTSD